MPAIQLHMRFVCGGIDHRQHVQGWGWFCQQALGEVSTLTGEHLETGAAFTAGFLVPCFPFTAEKTSNCFLARRLLGLGQRCRIGTGLVTFNLFSMTFNVTLNRDVT